MTHGIETGNKKYQHIRRDDEKWLLEDLQAIKRTVRKYIASAQPPDETEAAPSEKKNHKKSMTIDRVLAFVIFGIFGLVILLLGFYLIVKENYVVGIPGVVFGIVFVLALILFEIYR
jgi:uncharacterized membrane-anchored protein